MEVSSETGKQDLTEPQIRTFNLTCFRFVLQYMKLFAIAVVYEGPMAFSKAA